MTFDEAVREYRFRSSIGPLVQGIKISPFVNVPQQEYDQVKFLNNLFYATINKLRKEYAPTVEMTKEQADKINSFKNNLSASELPRVIHNYPEGDWSFLDELSGKLFGHQQGGMTDENIEDIMRIWLHPETIKVVDE